jgi:ribosomal protein S18 acetylase RimI-like enzyme
MRARHGAITIRRAARGDAPTIATVHVAAWQWAYGELLPADRLAALDTESRTATWRRILDEGEAEVWVATNPHVVGFAAVAVGAGTDGLAGYDELQSIYLLRSAQGVGVGRALMQEVVADMRRRRAPGAFLWVAEGNALAQRFYEGGGWRRDGAQRDIEVLGDHAVTIVRYVLDLD